MRIIAATPGAGVSVAAINDIAGLDKLAYGLRRDSVRGTFPGSVAVGEEHLLVNDQAIPVFNTADPAQIPWAKAGAEVVIDATGRFRDGEAARAHIIYGGARKVIISASADNPDAFLVYGANHGDYDPARHDVVSPASCGINAVAVMAKVLLDRFGLHGVHTFVVLATQGWQAPQDTVSGTSRDDPRLGRALTQNIIPHDHVVGDLLEVALPELGEVTYSYSCVPTPVGSMAELAGHTGRPVRADEVNAAMAQAAGTWLRGVLAYDPDPIVSSDVVGDPASCLFDPSGTQTTRDGRVKVRGWFDNEWGFAHRLLDLARLVG
jgi:glyceraldehyde 3-phosphate dehydrogenase